ncbi:hypothetical protein HG530_009043 [Fusarium avenaceum]|nr:hypothetical protein HG530_009043 [Fusarium avenaceum]
MYSNLNQNNLTNPLGVLGEEYLKSVQLLRHTLDIIQAINSNNKFDAFELSAKGSNTLLNLWLLQPFYKILRIDSDGESANGHEATVPIDAVGGSRTLEDTGAAAKEMTGIVVCVETDEIAVEKTGKESLSYRQDSVNFAAWERGMEKEANLDILFRFPNLLAKHLREKH